MNNTITSGSITASKAWLKAEDRSEETIQKYIRDIKSLSGWIGEKPLSKEALTEWKEHLKTSNYTSTTINSMLAAANTYCRFAGLSFRVKFLRVLR